ncbi:MAG: hypothetical protein D6677_13050 [Calditrichaeota bacterium]|nr:MAG: hypothetical protein D6677_13050 [Calditrichota bacterium]
MKIKWGFFLLFVCQTVWAGTPITRSFEFLRMDFNPRTVGAAGAFSTLSGDIGTMLQNPAGMAGMENHAQYMFSFNRYLLDINGGQMAYGFKKEGWGTLSAAITFLNYGEFKETDDFARETGNTFSANDLSLNVSLSDWLAPGLSYGVTLKYIYSEIADYNASAAAVDFGLLWDVPYDQDIKLGVAVSNLGVNFEYYGNVKDRLPLDIRLGLSKKLAHLPLTLAVSLVHLADPVERFTEYFKRCTVGGEFVISPALRLRLGYDYGLNQDLKTDLQGSAFGGVSGGVAFYYNQFRFDYAYNNYNLLGAVHMFSLSGTLP